MVELLFRIFCKFRYINHDYILLKTYDEYVSKPTGIPMNSDVYKIVTKKHYVYRCNCCGKILDTTKEKVGIISLSEVN